MAFAVLLIQVGMSFQVGSYEPMVEVSTRFGSGHLQIQHVDYKDHPRIERVVPNATEIREALLQVPEVLSVSNRTEAFALASKGEKSRGAMVVGVDPSVDPTTSYVSQQLIEGTYLEEPNSAFIGSALARNLDVKIGDDIVILAADSTGSVAFIAPTITGIFEIGNDALDRVLVQVPLSLINEALALDDGAHRVVIMVENPMRPELFAPIISGVLTPSTKLYDWQELMPEISQNIRLDKITNGIIYATLTVIIVLSIANTFVMTAFERTREFGMLRAVGMRPNALFGMFVLETLMMWVLGVALGYCLSTCVLGFLGKIGIGMDSMGMEQFAGLFFLPDRIYPAIDLKVVLVAPVSIGIGMLISSALASIRFYRMSLVEALRYKE